MLHVLARIPVFGHARVEALRGLLYAFVVFALFLFLELIEKLLDLRMIRFQQIECGLTPCAARCA